MAFLDNSGDIILDVVLTDHGRKVLAKGDGSFQITKFAVCDEEVDYSLYNTAHASGSAYYDIEILQTPILEAFTNNGSSMKTKLASFQDLNLLYLPILKLNTNLSTTHKHTNDTSLETTGIYLIAVDRDTEGTDNSGTTAAVGIDSNSEHVTGILFGSSFESSQTIRVDQGLDSSEISPKQSSLIGNMMEDVYIIQMDSRLGKLSGLQGQLVGEDYIDDDGVAYYTVSSQSGLVSVNTDDTNSSTQCIAGPRGSIIEFKIASSIELNTSTYLFSKLGSTFDLKNKVAATQSVRFIDSVVRVTGMKTGYSIDIPVRFIKTIIS
tara:strand:- start:407 stop:1372 length:966 start_codon:yes stop_codon:yes gene_type:complete